MAFCMRPAQGTVRAASVLNCELSFYPRFNVPSHGTFNLLVDGIKSDQVCWVDLFITSIVVKRASVLVSTR